MHAMPDDLEAYLESRVQHFCYFLCHEVMEVRMVAVETAINSHGHIGIVDSIQQCGNTCHKQNSSSVTVVHSKSSFNTEILPYSSCPSNRVCSEAPKGANHILFTFLQQGNLASWGLAICGIKLDSQLQHTKETGQLCALSADSPADARKAALRETTAQMCCTAPHSVSCTSS